MSFVQNSDEHFLIDSEGNKVMRLEFGSWVRMCQSHCLVLLSYKQVLLLKDARQVFIGDSRLSWNLSLLWYQVGRVICLEIRSTLLWIVLNLCGYPYVHFLNPCNTLTVLYYYAKSYPEGKTGCNDVRPSSLVPYIVRLHNDCKITNDQITWL